MVAMAVFISTFNCVAKAEGAGANAGASENGSAADLSSAAVHDQERSTSKASETGTVAQLCESACHGESTSIERTHQPKRTANRQNQDTEHQDGKSQ